MHLLLCCEIHLISHFELSVCRTKHRSLHRGRPLPRRREPAVSGLIYRRYQRHRVPAARPTEAGTERDLLIQIPRTNAGRPTTRRNAARTRRRGPRQPREKDPRRLTPRQERHRRREKEARRATRPHGHLRHREIGHRQVTRERLLPREKEPQRVTPPLRAERQAETIKPRRPLGAISPSLIWALPKLERRAPPRLPAILLTLRGERLITRAFTNYPIQQLKAMRRPRRAIIQRAADGRAGRTAALLTPTALLNPSPAPPGTLKRHLKAMTITFCRPIQREWVTDGALAGTGHPKVRLPPLRTRQLTRGV